MSSEVPKRSTGGRFSASINPFDRNRMCFPIFPVRSPISIAIVVPEWRIDARVSHYSVSFALFAGVWSSIASALWVRRWTSTDRRNGLIEREMTAHMYDVLWRWWVSHMYAISACYFWYRITLKFFFTRYRFLSKIFSFFLHTIWINKIFVDKSSQRLEIESRLLSLFFKQKIRIKDENFL